MIRINSIKYDDLGYERALLEVCKTRYERKKLYGDSWKTELPYILLASIVQKSHRLQFSFLSQKNINDIKTFDTRSYLSIYDSLVDLINYSLFLLEIVIKQNKQKGGNNGGE